MSITCTLGDILEIILALIVPPLAVLVKEGCGWDLFLNIILWCLGMLPGMVHALLVLQNHQRRAVHYTVVIEVQNSATCAEQRANATGFLVMSFQKQKMCGDSPALPPAPPLAPELWQHMHDVHCHIVETAESLAQLNTGVRTERVWVMATQPSEWELVGRIEGEYANKVVASFGIHPWFAHEQSDVDGAIAGLKALLGQHPRALVGEIGCDGVATHPGTPDKYNFALQLTLFQRQWDLAAQLKRPVSVHAVGCFGKLEAFFGSRLANVPKDLSRKKREKLARDGELVLDATTDIHQHPSLESWPPAIMLHSYSGSTESLRNILRYPSAVSQRFYFSFSHFVNSRTPFERMREKICAVPDDRVLVESDLHDAREVDNALVLALDLVARAKGWTMEEAAIRTGANALRFLSRVGL